MEQASDDLGVHLISAFFDHAIQETNSLQGWLACEISLKQGNKCRVAEFGRLHKQSANAPQGWSDQTLRRPCTQRRPRGTTVASGITHLRPRFPTQLGGDSGKDIGPKVEVCDLNQKGAHALECYLSQITFGLMVG